MYLEQLEQSKALYRQQLAECQHQENVIESLVRQRDALRAQQEVFLDQVGASSRLPTGKGCNPLWAVQRTEWWELLVGR